MNHTLDMALAILAVSVACLMPFASDTQAQTCNPPLGGGTDNVAWACRRRNRCGRIERVKPVDARTYH